MKAPLQLIAILVLVGLFGAAYNLASSGSPQRHLKWVSTVYKGSDKLGKGSEPPPAPPPEPVDGRVEKPGERPADEPGQKPPEAAAGQGAARPPEQKPAEPPAPPAASELVLVAIERVVEELESGSAIIDARRTRDYEAGHIPGALSFSPHEADFDEKVVRLASEAVLAAPVVIYCTNSKECEDSKLVARQLKLAGFVEIVIYQGGFPDWYSKKPEKVVKGKEPGSWK
ncbi:MAG: rhodanese-like domain-containing protein [Planctomycetes bacterium]|nr:rhodanese-like domain-containing protein [Planctomycetota bacterium]